MDAGRLPNTLTHTCMHTYTPSRCDPGTCIMHTHADKLLLTSKFFYTCHLVLICSFHLCLSLCLSPPSVSVHRSHYFCNQAEHCLGYFYTFLTLVCLLLSFTPSSVSCLCYKAVISAVQRALPPLSPSLSLLWCLFPITPASFTLSLHPPSPSLPLTR